jgi:nicotinamidase-related amidase
MTTTQKETEAAPVALLVIDMQEDFVLPRGRSSWPGPRPRLPALARLLALGRTRGGAVFHVVREHAPDGSDAEITRRGLFNGGGGFCLPGSDGARIVEPLRPLPGEERVVKKRFSAFFGTDLHARLTALGTGTVVIGGTQYPNCIRATATDALARDYRVIVVTDCCSAASQAVAEANVADLRAMGLTCVPLADLPRPGSRPARLTTPGARRHAGHAAPPSPGRRKMRRSRLLRIFRRRFVRHMHRRERHQPTRRPAAGGPPPCHHHKRNESEKV